jgi:ankyrin repeat protein
MFGLSVKEKCARAIAKGEFQTAKSLLNKLKHVDDYLKNGKNALHLALENNQFEIAAYLLEKGANVEKRTSVREKSPLEIVIEKGSLKALELLIKHGVDVHRMNEGGRTALHFAVINDHANLIEPLIKAGAYINAQDKDGSTSLYLAALQKKSKTLEALLAHKPDLELKSSGGTTPLMLAVIWGRLENVKALLAAGANIKALDNQNMTAFHHAAEKGDVEIVKELLAHGVDVKQRAGNLRTALELAKENGHYNVAMLIEEYKEAEEKKSREENEKIFKEMIAAAKRKAEEKPVEVYEAVTDLSEGRRLVEVFNFARRVKITFVQSDKMMSPPSELAFDNIYDQVNTLRPIWEAYQAKGGKIAEDSIYPQGVQKMRLSEIGVKVPIVPTVKQAS